MFPLFPQRRANKKNMSQSHSSFSNQVQHGAFQQPSYTVSPSALNKQLQHVVAKKQEKQSTNQPTKQNKQTSYYHWISLSWSCLEAAPTITATFAMDGRQMPTTTTFKAAELWGENPAKMVRWQNILNGMVMFAQRIHCPQKNGPSCCSPKGKLWDIGQTHGSVGNNITLILKKARMKTPIGLRPFFHYTMRRGTFANFHWIWHR